MSPDDARHGTEAGREQHIRDGEPSCDACARADLLASRRRSKRRTMGHEFTRPVGARLHARLVKLRADGARLDDIAAWAGISDSQVHRVIAGGPEQRIYARTWLALNTMRTQHLVTPVGAQRRLRALAWLGWSPAMIAAECGLHRDTISDIRDKGIGSTAKTRAVVAETFARLSMRMPPADTVTQRRAVGLVRSVARRKGWAPPLAFDDIDDPSERPHGGRRRTPRSEVDPVVVERVLAGDRLPMTTAERREVVARARGLGWSELLIRERTGIARATDGSRYEVAS